MKIKKNGISSTMAIAAIVVLVIVAAAGWAAYAAFPISKTVATTSTQTVTATQTAGTGGVQTVTQTVTQTGTSAANSTQSVYLQPITSTLSFKIAGLTTVPQLATWFSAQEGGFAKQYIPNAQFVSLGGAQITTALTSGAVQMAFSDPTGFLPSVAHGLPLQMVATTTLVPVQWMIIVAANSPYKTVQSLKGQTFGISTVNSVSEFYTEYAMSQCCGYTVNKDYSVSPLVSFQAINAAVLQGTVAAQATNLESIYPWLANGTERSVYNFSVPYQGGSLWTTTSFLQQHPDAVRAAVLAFVEGNYLWNTNSSFAYGILENNYGESASEAHFIYTQLPMSTDGAISISSVQTAVSFLLSSGVLTSNLTASDFIAQGIVPVTK